MPRISDLTRVNEVSDGDVFPIEQASSGRTRSVAFGTIRDDISADVDAAVSVAVAAAAAAEEAAASADAQILREELADGATALKGADLVAYDAGETVRDAIAASKQFDADLANTTDPAKGAAILGRGVVAVDSAEALPLAPLKEDLRYTCKGFLASSTVGGGEFCYVPSVAKSQHNGGTIISPTVPVVSAQPGATLAARVAAFISGTGETDPSGSGVFVKLVDRVVMASDFGLPTGGDDTASLAALNAAHLHFKLQAGDYYIDTFAPLAGSTVDTDGFDTVIHQNAGVVGDIRIINIQTSNVTVGDIALVGNIATDTGEQRHGIIVRNNSGQIDNVRIGNIKATNCRGDALYIGGNSSFNPTRVNFGDVYAENCYRNGVSITGGDEIVGGVIHAPSVGLFALDIEPDTAGGVVGSVKVSRVYGRQMGLLGEPTAGTVRKQVEIGSIELDGSLARSAPSIPATSTDRHGLIGRNTEGVRIGSAVIKNQNGSPVLGVFSGSDVSCKDWRIDSLLMENNNVDLSGTAIMQVAAWESFSVGTLENVSTTPATEILIQGDSGGTKRTRITIESMITDCRVANNASISCNQSKVSFAANAYALQNCYRGCVFQNAEWNVGRIAGFCTGEITFISADITYTGAPVYDSSIGTAFHVSEINSKLNGVWKALRVDNVVVH